MSQINPKQQHVRDLVTNVAGEAIRFCNRVIRHADLYGYELMELPDPDVHKMGHLMDVFIIPLLDRVYQSPHLLPDDAMTIDNVRQYSLNLKNVIDAINRDSLEDFERAIQSLRDEAMLLT
jgi:hypothetical protein